MKDSIQNKIKKIQKIALASNNRSIDVNASDMMRTNDSLSKSIRNIKEAELFKFELESAVNLAKSHSIKNSI